MEVLGGVEQVGLGEVRGVVKVEGLALDPLLRTFFGDIGSIGGGGSRQVRVVEGVGAREEWKLC